MAGFFLLLAMAAFFTGFVALIRPLPRIGLGRRPRSAVVLFVSLGVFAIAAGFLPKDAPAAAQAATTPQVAAGPPSLKAADTLITGVETDGPTLTVRADIKDAWDEEAYVVTAANIAKSVGRSLKRGVAEDVSGVKTVDLVFRASVKDRLGAESLAPFMTVSLSAADLKAAHYETLTMADVLNLATSVRIGGRAGRHAVATWCVKSFSDTPNFCATAAG